MGSQVGVDGHLHEFFALQASGMLLLLGAVLTEAASWGWQLWRRVKTAVKHEGLRRLWGSKKVVDQASWFCMGLPDQ